MNFTLKYKTIFFKVVIEFLAIVKRGILKNGIYIVATPIGNLGDISARAKEILQAAEIVACEDTRVTKKLFTLLGLSTRKEFIRLEDHNEAAQTENLVDMAQEGKIIAQVSDAGSPLISDPGYKLIRRCREEGVPVFAVPGACALICALQLSGLPTNSFMFAGFIPNKEKARVDLFNKLKDIDTTLVFYETANRIVKTLTAAADVFGDREIAVAREITKVYEECRNGTAAELIKYFNANEPKGEMVLMVSPPTSLKPSVDLEQVLREEMRNSSLKTAVKEVAEKYGFNKNEVYNLALRLKNE